MGVGCVLVENENDFTLSRTAYSTVSTYPQLGYDMMANPFYINSPLWQIVVNETHSVTCNLLTVEQVISPALLDVVLEAPLSLGGLQSDVVMNLIWYVCSNVWAISSSPRA